MTIQELFEWGNENDALNEPVSIPDALGTFASRIDDLIDNLLSESEG